jgi:hypothetical protein
VWRIDPGTGRATGTVPFHGQPTGLAVGDGSVWITDAYSIVTKARYRPLAPEPKGALQVNFPVRLVLLACLAVVAAPSAAFGAGRMFGGATSSRAS